MDAAAQVVPSAKDGLHCGTCLSGSSRYRYGVVPSAKDGLHCGLRLPYRFGRELATSSRPPRTGSIAAFSAACFVQRSGGRPVRQGRAPLRHVPERKFAISIRRRPVRQGRAPLRQQPGVEPAELARASSRPPRTGSIAARTPTAGCPGPRAVVPSAKDGLHCGRPPLPDVLHSHTVVPSAKDGLHCGTVRHTRHSPPPQVVPSAKDGLHCGLLLIVSPAARPRGRPVRQGRAPLRRQDQQRVGVQLLRSSRPPRTGSIAANAARK